MEKRVNYYIERSNPFVWLSAVLMIGSAVIRVIDYILYGVSSSTMFVFQIFLPVFSMLLFVLLMFAYGPTRIYRTTIPVVLGCISFAYRAMSFSLWHHLLCWLLYLVIGVLYYRTISGKMKHKLLCILSFLLPLLFHIFVEDYAIYHFNTLEQWIPEIPVLGIMAAVLCLLFALKRRPNDGTYYPTWGDRFDGRRIRTLSPMAMVSPYIMVHRNGSSNFIRDSVEITEMERYIRRKRKEGLSNFGIQHVFVAAYIRAVSQYPGLNRFLSGQKVYARHNVEIEMTIKKEMSVNSPDTVINLIFTPDATADDVYNQFNAAVEEVKNTPLNSGFDNLAGVISSIPSIFLKFFVWLLKLLDYFGMLPKMLLRLSPFHGSFFITSMGSLGIPPIYHHLYDFGNLPVFLSFGAKRRVNEVEADGTIVKKKYVDFTVVTDERICDGFYYAAGLKCIRRCLMHPDQLDKKPEKIVSDID